MFDELMADLATGCLEPASQDELEALWESWSNQSERSVSAEVAGLDPGLMLAATLDSVDVESLSGRDRVAVMVALQRMVSHYEALLYASMVSVADAVTETVRDDAEGDVALIEDACATEIRAALRLTRRAADNELAVARGFRERLPHVWEALASGRIDRRRASLIVHRTDHLSVGQAREVADRALEKAPELTTGQLTALLARLGAETDPDDAKQRYTTAVEGRRVILEPGVDGTAHLYLMDLPPDRAARIRAGIDAAARKLRGKGESRTMDQLRADVVMDLLDPATSGTTPRSGRGAIVMTVDLATLAGLAETTGELGGYGSVISDIARQVADQSPDAEWRFVVTEADGRPLGGGTTRRRPTTAQRRIIQTLYPTCTFLGCRMPAIQSDIDHMTPYVDSGVTRVDSLAPLCSHDHTIRHGAGWSYRRTADGYLEWTSPLGVRYLNRDQPP